MKNNVFDLETEDFPAVTTASNENTGGALGGAIGGLFIILVLVAILPLYIHGLVKIAIWSWNLI